MFPLLALAAGLIACAINKHATESSAKEEPESSNLGEELKLFGLSKRCKRCRTELPSWSTDEYCLSCGFMQSYQTRSLYQPTDPMLLSESIRITRELMEDPLHADVKLRLPYVTGVVCTPITDCGGGDIRFMTMSNDP